MLAALSASWRVHGVQASRSETQTSSWSHHVSALSQAAPLNLHGYGQNGRGWLGGGWPRVKRGGAWRAVTAGCRLHGVAWTSCMASSTPCHASGTLFARSTKCTEFVRPVVHFDRCVQPGQGMSTQRIVHTASGLAQTPLVGWSCGTILLPLTKRCQLAQVHAATSDRVWYFLCVARALWPNRRH